MLALINGSGLVTKMMAYNLLRDFVYPFSKWTLLFPEQEEDPTGMANAYDAALDLEEKARETYGFTQSERVKLYKNFESDFLVAVKPGEEKYLLCLGTDGLKYQIMQCLANEIPVKDLTRAMYPVTKA